MVVVVSDPPLRGRSTAPAALTLWRHLHQQQRQECPCRWLGGLQARECRHCQETRGDAVPATTTKATTNATPGSPPAPAVAAAATAATTAANDDDNNDNPSALPDAASHSAADASAIASADSTVPIVPEDVSNPDAAILVWVSLVNGYFWLSSSIHWNCMLYEFIY